MTTMNISLPDELKAFVDAQIQKGGYSSISEYVRELIRHAQREAAQDRLEERLLEGLDSGKSTALDSRNWDAIRTRLKKRARSRKPR